ncbi:MAG: hypothetical protein CMK89_21150 [Pseudomonadales bacterium]|nr:hypothetical protein [Pseudomonadales bacterium]
MSLANNIASTLYRTAEQFAEQPAIYHGEAVYVSWQQLLERVEQLAALLQQLGLAEGDCVGLAMTNCPAYIETLYACWRLGLIAVPMNAKGHASDFQYMLEHSRSRVCLVSDALLPTINKACDDSARDITVLSVNSDELSRQLSQVDTASLLPVSQNAELPAWLFYTSGTTGRPKGATLTHGNLLAMADAFFQDLEEVESGDHLIHAAPMSHGSGLYIIPHIIKGACQVVPVSGKFNGPELVSLINHFGNSRVFAAPTMLQRLLEDPATDSLPGLKTIILGGGPLYVQDCINALRKFGPKIAQIYGQGETPMTITGMTRQAVQQAYEQNDSAYLGSVGSPFSSVEVAVVDEQGKPLPAGTAGEIVVRGPTVMQGYWENPPATADTIRDGWLYTGDIGTFDVNGVLTLKDRSKDLIISGGTNIYPREVEEILITHPDIKEACVVGVTDPEWGESVAAVVVTEAGAELSSDEIDQFCIEHLARFKRPKRYLVASELPKNATGKVLKAKVKAMLEH